MENEKLAGVVYTCMAVLMLMAMLVSGCADHGAGSHPTTDMPWVPASSDMAHADLLPAETPDMAETNEDMTAAGDMAQQQIETDFATITDLAMSGDMTQCLGAPLGALCDGATMCCRGVCGHIGGIVYECCLPAGSSCTDGSECCSRASSNNVCD